MKKSDKNIHLLFNLIAEIANNDTCDVHVFAKDGSKDMLINL